MFVFSPFKSDLSGNNVKSQASGFQTLPIFNQLLSTQDVNLLASLALLNETFSVIFKHRGDHKKVVSIALRRQIKKRSGDKLCHPNFFGVNVYLRRPLSLLRELFALWLKNMGL